MSDAETGPHSRKLLHRNSLNKIVVLHTYRKSPPIFLEIGGFLLLFFTFLYGSDLVNPF